MVAFQEVQAPSSPQLVGFTGGCYRDGERGGYACPFFFSRTKACPTMPPWHTQLAQLHHHGRHNVTNFASMEPELGRFCAMEVELGSCVRTELE